MVAPLAYVSRMPGVDCSEVVCCMRTRSKCAGMLLHWLYALEDCTDAQLTIRHLHQGFMQGLHAAYNNMHQLSTARHNLD